MTSGAVVIVSTYCLIEFVNRDRDTGVFVFYNGVTIVIHAHTHTHTYTLHPTPATKNGKIGKIINLYKSFVCALLITLRLLNWLIDWLNKWLHVITFTIESGKSNRAHTTAKCNGNSPIKNPLYANKLHFCLPSTHTLRACARDIYLSICLDKIEKMLTLGWLRLWNVSCNLYTQQSVLQ